jgi:Flp pilus assembly protein TadG
MHPRRPDRQPRRRGSIAVTLTVWITPIVGVMAIVLDGGMMFTERRHAQATADAAALAAAGKLYVNYSVDQGLDPNHTASAAALAIAAGNGYSNDGTTTTVTVNIAPKSGLFQGKSGYAEVLVQYNSPRLFSAIWGAGTWAVTSRSMGRAQPNGGGIGILLLDPTMKASLNSTGNGGVSVVGGSIIVDSNNARAGFVTGNGNVSAPNINFTGDYATTGSGHFVGDVQTGVPPTPDPLAGVPEPSTTGMAIRSTSNYKISGSGVYTLYPGVYTGGISISAPGPGLITLQPGIYYMDGGGFSNSGSINMIGNGVMIYNSPKQTSDQIKLTGSGSLTLTPPTSGPYKNLTLFQDRTSTAVLTITGNGGMNISGGTYAAKAEMDVTGNGASTNIGSQIVVNNMKVTGNGPINVTYDPNGVPAKRDLRIVE